MPDSDVLIIGGGAAGLSLAWRLLRPPPGVPAPRVTLVDAPAGPLRPPERTWCYWEKGPGDYDAALTTSWQRLRVRGADGEPLTRGIGDLRYKMLRSSAFERALRPALTSLRRTEAVAEEIHDLPGGAEARCRTADGGDLRLRARWVFDSRPPAVPPRARVALLQHFKGWFVRTEKPVFTPDTVDLMDFRTPQPDHGLAFGYVLPLDPYEALVEYTQFSPAALTDAAYDRALHHYTEAVLGLGPLQVRGVERGAIPMSDGRHARRAGRHVFRIGTAGGAIRPSTGYAFAAVQRQTKAVAEALHHGREPLPPRAYPLRSHAMDTVMLRGLDTGRIAGPDFFTRLFAQVPAERLLRFLDGDTHPGEDLLIGLHTPVRAMLRTVAELPFTARRRT
ncbi:lycopene cyclase family protein [Streptomyces sp. NPDC090127]|uniref:lycopene cyclase family protein n=1 Tax=Streptomyces sp. NPDC090127 TaxID=3365953 RepID=UPI00380A255D